MRSRLALAVALALVVTSVPARAAPSVRGGAVPVIRGDDLAAREACRVVFTPLAGAEPTLAVELDLTYLDGVDLPTVDSVDVGAVAPDVITARSDSGRVLSIDVRGDARRGHHLVVALPLPSEEGARREHLRFEQAAPTPRRFGWVHALAEVDWPEHLQARAITSVVHIPVGMSLSGHACDGDGTCVRTSVTPRRIPVVVRAPVDALGLGLLAVTLAASVVGFARGYRRRAAALVEELRAAPVPSSTAPGGAYREPPPRAVGVSVDATFVLRALTRRAAVVVVPAVLSTVAVAYLASGVSPWPMPSLLSAWIAVVGFAAGHLIARR